MNTTHLNIEDFSKPKAHFLFSKKVSLVDKYNFYEYVSVMLDSGISISESLGCITERIKSVYFKDKIKELLIYISSGDAFSKSMKKMPNVFENFEISIIEAGETTGMLAESLLKLSNDLKKVHALRNKIKSAMTYPFIIFLFLLVAVIIVLTYVIPAIKPLFDTAEVALPFATQSLIFISDFVGHNILILILFLFSCFVLFVGYKSTKTGKKQIENFIFFFPLIGKIYKNYLLANIAGTLANLVGSGVNIVKTFTLVGKTANSVLYEELFAKISLRVSTGEKIVDAMKAVDPETKYFPLDFLQMLSVGEKTASLDKMSLKMNTQYEKEVDYALTNFTKWIEPIAILIAGVFVLWFAFAIFGAILKVTQTVG